MTEEDLEALFQRWIQCHLGLLIKVARSFAVNRDDQEDLIQDILINLWSSISRFRGESKETTWIYQVAFRTAMIWQRGERRRQKHQSLYTKNVSVGNQPSTDECGERKLIDHLYTAIRRLPKVDASIALMHLDGLAYREIAEVLGISENYVGVKLTRIRKDLADLFEELRQRND